MFNLAGALFYLAVAAAAWRAALHCRSGANAKQGARLAFHWQAVALLFAGLAVWRLGAGEAVVQTWVREATQASGSYALRQRWQAPVAALAMLGGGAWIIWLVAARHADPLLQWSRFASLGLLAYSMFRLVSFHSVDAVIYRSFGPFHLNHGIDLGLAALAGWCAILACRTPGDGRGGMAGSGRG